MIGIVAVEQIERAIASVQRDGLARVVHTSGMKITIEQESSSHERKTIET